VSKNTVSALAGPIMHRARVVTKVRGECEWKRGDGQPKRPSDREVAATTVALMEWPSHRRFHVRSIV
jgi:hypothetical protein